MAVVPRCPVCHSDNVSKIQLCVNPATIGIALVSTALVGPLGLVGSAIGNYITQTNLKIKTGSTEVKIDEYRCKDCDSRYYHRTDTGDLGISKIFGEKVANLDLDVKVLWLSEWKLYNVNVPRRSCKIKSR